MINFIEHFLEETEGYQVFSGGEKNQQDEVYFFLGKKDVLCIRKSDNKVLYSISLQKLQISLLSPTEFSIGPNGSALYFFCKAVA